MTFRRHVLLLRTDYEINSEINPRFGLRLPDALPAGSPYEPGQRDHCEMQFTPWSETPRPCWHCYWYGGFDGSHTHAICNRPGATRRRTQPASGCSAFEREVGADDELGPPLPFNAPRPPFASMPPSMTGSPQRQSPHPPPIPGQMVFLDTHRQTV
jgi:hypothetical protein